VQAHYLKVGSYILDQNFYIGQIGRSLPKSLVVRKMILPHQLCKLLLHRNNSSIGGETGNQGGKQRNSRSECISSKANPRVRAAVLLACHSGPATPSQTTVATIHKIATAVAIPGQC
jgi:hypothetical protein